MSDLSNGIYPVADAYVKLVADTVVSVLAFCPPEAFFWTVHITFTCGVPEANPVNALPTFVNVKVVEPTPLTHAGGTTSAAFPAVAIIISELDCKFPPKLVNATVAVAPDPDTVPSTSFLTLYSNGSAGSEPNKVLTPSYGNLNTIPLLPESNLVPAVLKSPWKSWFDCVWNTFATFENVWPEFITISNKYKRQIVEVATSKPLTLASPIFVLELFLNSIVVYELISGIPLTVERVRFTKLPIGKKTEFSFSFTWSLGLSTATYLVAKFSTLNPWT